MEFYYPFVYYWIDLFEVSIPNGMEFYGNPKSFGIDKISFNSQRDGILRYVKINVKSVGFSFNSQRDGILH